VGTSDFLHFTAIAARESRTGKFAGGGFDLIEKPDTATLGSTRFGRLGRKGMGNLARNSTFAITKSRRWWRLSVCRGKRWFIRLCSSSRARPNTG
jgi:hypothetical protein